MGTGGVSANGTEETGTALRARYVTTRKYRTATELRYERPDAGLHLTCSDRDWRLRCGIESYFLARDEAMVLQRDVGSGDAVARVRIDDDGNAALIAVETE